MWVTTKRIYLRCRHKRKSSDSLCTSQQNESMRKVATGGRLLWAATKGIKTQSPHKVYHRTKRSVAPHQKKTFLMQPRKEIDRMPPQTDRIAPRHEINHVVGSPQTESMCGLPQRSYMRCHRVRASICGPPAATQGINLQGRRKNNLFVGRQRRKRSVLRHRRNQYAMPPQKGEEEEEELEPMEERST